MNFHIDVSSTTGSEPVAESPAPEQSNEVADLLREILTVQKEILNCQRALLQSQDAPSRWKAFLKRWEEFAELPAICRQALPVLEQIYGETVSQLGEQLNEEDESLESEFALREMLDRYGPQIAHLGTLLNVIAPLADPRLNDNS